MSTNAPTDYPRAQRSTAVELTAAAPMATTRMPDGTGPDQKVMGGRALEISVYLLALNPEAELVLPANESAGLRVRLVPAC